MPEPVTSEFQVPRHLDQEIEDFLQRGDLYFLRRYIQAEQDDRTALALAKYVGNYIAGKMMEGIVSG